IDMGPEAGEEGGHVVAAGTPEQLADQARRYGRLSEAQRAKTLRSHTAEALAPVLEAGPHEKRVLHDFEAEARRLEGDLDITEVGRTTKMPWEADGRKWHTRDRVGRTGNPCRWDGRILADVVDRIEQSDLFSPTDWSNRGVVEIRAAKKSHGWFFHAITGEEWLLKMKFRVPKSTFRREELVPKLDLKPLNDMPELPLYGTQNRTKCRNIIGPWQEVELRVHAYDEIDRPVFWEFVDAAVAGFGRYVDRASQKPADLMPWKVLGRKWHLARKGFYGNPTVRWDVSLLERIFDLLAELAPKGKYQWTNKQVVTMHLPRGGRRPWAAVRTKRPDAVHVHLFGPKGRFPLGRVTGLGHDPSLREDQHDTDIFTLKFCTAADLQRGDLVAFLKEHLASREE
ncbi:MAG: excinuclease ABC subunit A, partial [Pirellulales bacterium]|nr:excinuclease ABC subunit A [Pirellulales bacterium]